MFSLNYWLDNLARFKEGSEKKGIVINWSALEKMMVEVRQLSREVEALRQKRKGAAKKRDLVAGKELKTKLETLEDRLTVQTKKLAEELDRIPNPPLSEVPEGGKEKNQVVDVWGEPREFPFTPKDHLALGEALGVIDVERGVKTSGSRFYFLKNEAVELEWAILVWLADFFKKEGFQLLITPELVKAEVMRAGGYLPYGQEEVYHLEKDELYLLGTAEQSILGYHLKETLPEEKLPLRYLGFSSSFRREAGSYGQDVRGIIRTHQFDKLEMFSFVKPADSPKEHEYLIKLEEKILQALALPYRKVLVAAGDLGLSAAKKIDLEVWLPSQKRYLEVTSCSNCTDFQARRGGIRYRLASEQVGRLAGKSGTEYVHTLNGTAVAIGRLLVVVLENYQAKDGAVTIPKVLQPYLTFRSIQPKP